MKLAAIQRALEERARQLPRPRLAPGTELIGEYEGSGFKQPQYIARRADGRILQLPHLLYLVAAASDGTRDLRDLAEILSENLHRHVTIDNVRYLVGEKLSPLGLIDDEDGSAPEPQSHQPLLALKFRQAVIPPRVVNVAARIFQPLFFPLVIGAVLAWVATLDVWLFFHHGVAAGVREILYRPALLVAMLGLLAVSALFHECGHAAACRYGGATPGAMGAGLYVVWPAFYTDVTDAYRLNRVGRLRTDLGGVYFNLVFILAVAGVYFWTGFEPLLALIALQHAEIIHQFIPWIRLDGYYVVSDLTGVPDVMSRVKPTLLSLIPGRKAHPRVDELKPWVRGVVGLYVLTVVPVLVAFTALMILAAPHVFATAASSAKLEAARISAAAAHGRIVDIVIGVVQLVALALPPVGMALTLLKLARTTTTHVVRQLAPRPRLRYALVVGACAAAAVAGFARWSNASFKPIGRDARGTFGDATAALRLRRPPVVSPPPATGKGGSRPAKRDEQATTSTDTETTDRTTPADTTEDATTTAEEPAGTTARSPTTATPTTNPPPPPPPTETTTEVTTTETAPTTTATPSTTTTTP